MTKDTPVRGIPDATWADLWCLCSRFHAGGLAPLTQQASGFLAPCPFSSLDGTELTRGSTGSSEVELGRWRDGL